MLCAMDVDALCACKILQSLFKGDDIQHTVIPVAGKADAKVAYSDHADQVGISLCRSGVRIEDTLGPGIFCPL